MSTETTPRARSTPTRLTLGSPFMTAKESAAAKVQITARRIIPSDDSPRDRSGLFDPTTVLPTASERKRADGILLSLEEYMSALVHYVPPISPYKPTERVSPVDKTSPARDTASSKKLTTEALKAVLPTTQELECLALWWAVLTPIDQPVSPSFVDSFLETYDRRIQLMINANSSPATRSHLPATKWPRSGKYVPLATGLAPSIWAFDSSSYPSTSIGSSVKRSVFSAHTPNGSRFGRFTPRPAPPTRPISAIWADNATATTAPANTISATQSNASPTPVALPSRWPRYGKFVPLATGSAPSIWAVDPNTAPTAPAPRFKTSSPHLSRWARLSRSIPLTDDRVVAIWSTKSPALASGTANTANPSGPSTANPLDPIARPASLVPPRAPAVDFELPRAPVAHPALLRASARAAPRASAVDTPPRRAPLRTPPPPIRQLKFPPGLDYLLRTPESQIFSYERTVERAAPPPVRATPPSPRADSGLPLADQKPASPPSQPAEPRPLAGPASASLPCPPADGRPLLARQESDSPPSQSADAPPSLANQESASPPSSPALTTPDEDWPDAPHLHLRDLSRPVCPRIRQRESWEAPRGLPDLHGKELIRFLTSYPGGKQTLNECLARYYATEVITKLMYPGTYRSGTGGADDRLWGEDAVRRDSLVRMGKEEPRVIEMTSRQQAPERWRFDQYKLNRHHPLGPYGQPGRCFVDALLELITRLHVSHTSVVTALYILDGLSLHFGDPKSDFYRALRKLKASLGRNAGGMWLELSVALIGLMLAGKLLEDNSFKNHSWSSVASLPTRELQALEFAALKELNWSLYINHNDWRVFIHRHLYTAMQRADCTLEDTKTSDVMITILQILVADVEDHMVIGAPRGDTIMFPKYDTFPHEVPAIVSVPISVEADPHVPSPVHSEPKVYRAMSVLCSQDTCDFTDDGLDGDYDGAPRFFPSLREVKVAEAIEDVQEAVRLWVQGVDPHYDPTAPPLPPVDDDFLVPLPEGPYTFNTNPPGENPLVYFSQPFDLPATCISAEIAWDHFLRVARINSQTDYHVNRAWTDRRDSCVWSWNQLGYDVARIQGLLYVLDSRGVPIWQASDPPLPYYYEVCPIYMPMTEPLPVESISHPP